MTTGLPQKTALGKYSGLAIFLHWVVALLIAINLVLVWTVDYLPDAMTRPIIDTHKSIGITVLGLALLRLLWRFSHRPPPLPLVYSQWERIASKIAHILLYVLILCLPLSGWMHDSAWKDGPTHPVRLFGLVPWPRIGLIMDQEPATKEMLHDVFFKIHSALAYALYLLLALHIGAALKHQFWEKQPELERMLP